MGKVLVLNTRLNFSFFQSEGDVKEGEGGWWASINSWSPADKLNSLSSSLGNISRIVSNQGQNISSIVTSIVGEHVEQGFIFYPLQLWDTS